MESERSVNDVNNAGSNLLNADDQVYKALRFTPEGELLS
jgi:hypothetical protein